MIGRCSLDSQHGEPGQNQWILAVLILDAQTTLKATTQLRNINEKIEQRKQQKCNSLSIEERAQKKNDRKLGKFRKL